MASPTTPTHGKWGAIYRLRPNGFEGVGLNDITWGTAFDDQDGSAYFEVVIDAEGTPDTFKFRKSGGSWTTGISITGSAQYLSGESAWVAETAYSLNDLVRPTTHNGYWYKCTTAGTSDTAEPTWPTTLGNTVADGTAVWTCQGKYQTVTFAATTGHTLNDQWTIGNLVSEACTESGVEAQITDTTRRILNPNVIPTFTDSGGESVETIDFTQGKATFSGNVTAVTVTGNNGYIPSSTLEKVGYLIDWSFTVNFDLADASRMGQSWKEYIPGQAGGSGNANGFFIGGKTFFEGIENQEYFFLQLFNYDPDQDGSGDHFNAWVVFNSEGVNPTMNEAVKESLGFTLHGIPSFTANA